MEKIKITGMSCQHCVMAVSKALEKLEGIKNVKVDLPQGEATFENPGKVARNRIRKAVEDAGYQVSE